MHSTISHFILLWDRHQSVQWRTQEKNSGGCSRQGVRLRSGSGGRSPPDAGEFSKFCKKFLNKIAKNVVLSPIVQKNFKTIR